ncbi:MAG: glycosyltransferase [Microbacterium sp.]
MSHLRVLHLADSLHGGGAESVFRTTIELSRRFAPELRVLTATGRTTPGSYVYSRRNQRILLAELRSFGPDVVHIQNYYHALSPSVLGALRIYKKSRPALRVVFTAHDYHLVCPNSGMQHFPQGIRTNVPIDEDPVRLMRRYDHRSWFHAILKIAQFSVAYRLLRLQRVIDEVISPSHFLASALHRRGLRARVSVVRNPLSLERGAGPSIESDRRSPIDVVSLGFVGRLVPEKGLGELIRALSQLRDEVPTELHVFGEGPQKQELIALTDKLQLGNRVVFHGRVPHAETWAAVSALDTVVVPSVWYENAPQVVLEAAAVGVPVIGNDLGGVAEMCDEITNAQLCNTADPAELGRALRAVRTNGGVNALRRPEDYSPRHYARELRRIYVGDSISS